MKTGCVDQLSLNENTPPDEKNAKNFCSNMVEMGKCKIDLMQNISSGKSPLELLQSIEVSG